jgi:fluoroquinolone transport system permease protein
MIGASFGLVRHDAKNMLRDPMLGFALLAPPLLWAALRYGLPAADALLGERLGVTIAEYKLFALAFALQLVPLLLGMLAGFVMLEERDERLIACFAVTPLGKAGYVKHRLSHPLALSLIWTFLLGFGSGIAVPSLLPVLSAILLSAIQTPLYSLLLAAYAGNKVEGLAISKLAGLAVFAPALAFFAPWPWQLAGALLPGYWAAKLMVLGGESGNGGDTVPALLAATTGMILTCAFYWHLYRAYAQKVE